MSLVVVVNPISCEAAMMARTTAKAPYLKQEIHLLHKDKSGLTEKNCPIHYKVVCVCVISVISDVDYNHKYFLAAIHHPMKESY